MKSLDKQWQSHHSRTLDKLDEHDIEEDEDHSSD